MNKLPLTLIFLFVFFQLTGQKTKVAQYLDHNHDYTEIGVNPPIEVHMNEALPGKEDLNRENST